VRRVLIEAAVIVGSILLAFGIDAGWDTKGERATARAVLLDLEAEFRESLALIDQIIRIREGRASSAESLLEGMAAFPDQQSLDLALVQVFLTYTTVNVPTGAHTSYLGGTSASTIEPQALRTLLASWPGKLEDNAEDEAIEIQRVNEQLTPFLTERINLGPVYNAHPAQIYGEFPTEDVGTGLEAERLLSDPEFRNLVRVRLARTRVLVREARALRAAAQEILDLVVDQLRR
jgi:hypothetical protein